MNQLMAAAHPVMALQVDFDTDQTLGQIKKVSSSRLEDTYIVQRAPPICTRAKTCNYQGFEGTQGLTPLGPPTPHHNRPPPVTKSDHVGAWCCFVTYCYLFIFIISASVMYSLYFLFNVLVICMAHFCFRFEKWAHQV